MLGYKIHNEQRPGDASTTSTPAARQRREIQSNHASVSQRHLEEMRKN